MSNLRQAAQQALEAMDNLHRTGDTQVFDLCHRETTEALRAALAEQCTHGVTDGNCKECYMAEPEQEPVAWMEMVVANLVREGVNKHKARQLAQHFTTPPQRKPLTEEEIWNLLPDDNTPMSLGEAFLKFARLIEAAHGIGEKK